MSQPLPRALLIEPQFVLRRAIVLVARDLGVMDFDEASSTGRARLLMASQPYACLVLDLEERPEALDLISDLRSGKLACRSDTRVVVVGGSLQPADSSLLEALGVTQVFGKPLRISELLEALKLRN